MGLRIQCLCIQTTDPARLAAFWQSALTWRRTHAEDDEVVLEPPAGSPEDGVAPDLLFQRGPEEKAGKNRLHLDLRPQDQAAEVTRLEELGARRVDVGQGSDVSWVVMGDPDGNEFCVLRALTEAELAEDQAETLDAAQAGGSNGRMVMPLPPRTDLIKPSGANS